MPIERTTVPLSSLGCGGGSRMLVERALLAVPGVLKAYVNPVTEMAYVEYDSTQCGEPQIRAAAGRTGFGEREPIQKPAAAERTTEPRSLQVGGFALTAGVWLAAAFALSALVRPLWLGLSGGGSVWALLVPGLDPWRWWSLPVGLAAALVYGLAGGWLFATLYNTLARRRPGRGFLRRPPAGHEAPNGRTGAFRAKGMI